MQQFTSDSQSQLVVLKDILGQCDAINTIRSQIKQIAPTDCTVLVIGETGSGKGLFAQRIYNLSNRTDKPLILMNCATPPETTLEAEIFGFSSEPRNGHNDHGLAQLQAVNGATLMIDEVSELSPDGQANLLEALELVEHRNQAANEKLIDIRLIVTSQFDLQKLVDQGKFNKRLYYHLNIFTIHIPPLRERGDDKIGIAESLLASSCTKYGKGEKHFSPEAINEISSYHWPGNYRELRNAIERAVVMSDNPVITKDMLLLDRPSEAAEDNQQTTSNSQQKSEDQTDLSLEDYFQHFVLEHQDHMTETELAQKLGVSRKCLWERRQKFGIPRSKSQTRN